MSTSATARAQADEALEQAAQALKRQQGVTRKALQAVRQAQVNLIGISVEIENTQPKEGMVDDNENETED